VRIRPSERPEGLSQRWFAVLTVTIVTTALGVSLVGWKSPASIKLMFTLFTYFDAADIRQN
jgi:hypothetical protein